jgi:hypothetical protein
VSASRTPRPAVTSRRASASRIAAVDLAVTGAPPALVKAAWLAAGTQHQLDREEYIRYESGRTHEPDPIQVAPYHFAQSAGALPCGRHFDDRNIAARSAVCRLTLGR